MVAAILAVNAERTVIPTWAPFVGALMKISVHAPVRIALRLHSHDLDYNFL